MICLLKSYSIWPSRVRRNFFLLRSMSSDLNVRSSELICWLTADCVTLLIWAALVKLSVSAKSQNTFKLSTCIRLLKPEKRIMSTYHSQDLLGLFGGGRLGPGRALGPIGQGVFDGAEEVLAGEGLL